MINDLNNISDIKKCNISIQFADGKIVNATHKGTYKEYIYNRETLLHDEYVSVFKRCLLSLTF